LEFRDLVFVEMYGEKSLVNNCVSDVYDDFGSGNNVQYRLNQQEFRLEKLRAKFCNKSKAANEKSSFAETSPTVNDNEIKDIENSYLGDYEHEDLTERFEKMEIRLQKLATGVKESNKRFTDNFLSTEDLVARTDLLLEDLFDTQPSVKPGVTLCAIRNVKTKGNLSGDSSGASRQERKQVSVLSLEVPQSQHATPEKCQQSAVFVKETGKLSVTVDESVGASRCFKLDDTESYNPVSQTNMKSRLSRLSKKTREIAQPTEDLVAETLEARCEVKATSVLETTVVGSCPTASEVLISHVGEGYLSQNEMDLSWVDVSDKDIISLEVKDLDRLARFETRGEESEQMFNGEAVMSANLHDHAHMTGSITLRGEKGIECSEGKMLRQESWTKDTTEMGSAMTVALAERNVAVDAEEVATLVGSPAMFCYFAKSSVVIGNTGEDWRSGEVYDATMSSHDKSIRMELFHGHSDEPQKDLNCNKDFLLDPSIDLQFADTENVYNLNESPFRTMCVDDLEEKHGEVTLEYENAEECCSLIGEESDQGSSLTKRTEVSGTKYLVLEGGGLDFVADIALAKNALCEYPDLQAQFVSSEHPGGCVSFLHEKIEDVGQSGDCATLLHEGNFNGNELRRRVFDPGGLGLRFDYCRGCCREESFTV